MASYSEISDDWVYLLMPRGETFDTFEATDGRQDRLRTKAVLDQMENELPRTFKNILGITPFEYSLSVLKQVDFALTSDVMELWRQQSDPGDPNNFSKLTLSEL